MADYYTPTVIPELIPNADMTKLEYLLLTRIFEADCDGDRTYFHSWEGPQSLIRVARSELEAALAASRGSQSQVLDFVQFQFEKAEVSFEDIELDLSAISWEHIVQDIVRRSPTLRYVTVTAAFTCSRMRADGFGGMAVFITAENIKWCSTTEFLSDCLAEIISDDGAG